MTDQTLEPDPKPSAKLLTFEIGQRVRRLRRKHSLTRRQLSETTSISERYLGQLENGQANASINILHKIATRFGESVAALIPASGTAVHTHQPLADLLSGLTSDEQETAYQLLANRFRNGHAERKGIAMVGLRGAGKTTLGEQLAALTNVPFVRLSQLVANRAGLETSEIMELWGPTAFRRFEYEALRDLIEQPGKVILETSGGIVASDTSYELLVERFHTVWLRAEPDEHMQRVIDQNDLRPMIGRSAAMQDLVALLREREPLYGRADHTLDTTGRSIRDCLAELVDVSKPVICP
jgi:XRE family aerobic/anaerobic benzoate catabolism transcriptional regulator